MRVLWFSGGKDSVATLLLHKEELKDIYVLWANTGRYYPEALAFIEIFRAMCPNWIEVKTDRVGQWEKNGYPSDVVPIDWTILGQSLSAEKPIKMQSYLQCCYENIGGALWAKSVELGATEIIRGQRADEAHKSTADDGSVKDGVVFRHPIETWSANEVLSFVEEKLGYLPEHFKLDHSSMDCFDCTAFAAHSADRAKYTKERHPALYAEYRIGLDAVISAIKQASDPYMRIP